MNNKKRNKIILYIILILILTLAIISFCVFKSKQKNKYEIRKEVNELLGVSIEQLYINDKPIEEISVDTTNNGSLTVTELNDVLIVEKNNSTGIDKIYSVSMDGKVVEFDVSTKNYDDNLINKIDSVKTSNDKVIIEVERQPETSDEQWYCNCDENIIVKYTAEYNYIGDGQYSEKNIINENNISDKYDLSICQENKIKLTVNLNNGTSTQNFETEYNKLSTLILEKPEKEGYNFIKWNVVSGDATIVDNVLTFGEKDTTIEAVYECKNIKFFVNLNDGKTRQNFKKEYEAMSLLVLEQPSKVGYNFIKWNVTSGDATIENNVIKFGKKDTSIEAIYERKTIKLSIELRGGNTKQNFEKEYQSLDSLILEKPNKFGYNFIKWNVISGDATIVDNILTFGEKDSTIEAIYEINSYEINYILNGANNDEFVKQGKYNQILNIKNPVKEGYRFVGWKITGDIDQENAKHGNTETNINQIINGNITSNYFINLSTTQNGKITFEAIFIDETAPKINSITKNTNEWTNQDVILLIDANDSGSGIKKYYLSKNENITSDDDWNLFENKDLKIEIPVSENAMYYFYVKDETGNVSKSSVKIDNIDKNEPKGRIGHRGNICEKDNYSKLCSFEMPIEAFEETCEYEINGECIYSGVKEVRYAYSKSYDETPTDWSIAQNDKKDNYSAPGNLPVGSWYLWVQIEDNAGNIYEFVGNYIHSVGGWDIDENNNWRYYDISSGEKLTGWINVAPSKNISQKYYYYLDPLNDGILYTGFLDEDSARYYLDEKGESVAGLGYMVTQWYKVNGKWYYFNSSGHMQKGWVQTNTGRYYLTEDGSMATGWLKIKGKKYYFEYDSTEVPEGKMVTGWFEYDGKWYYFTEEGDAVTGWKIINSLKYYFNSEGEMQKGWLTESGYKYYLNNDGVMLQDWQQISGKWYYFDSNNYGRMVVGWKTIDSKKYYFNSSGEMVTGWFEYDSKWYYFTDEGYAVTGWKIINSLKYYFNSKGEMQKGWLTESGYKYYLNNDGVMLQGWQQISGKWYYFDSNNYGRMVVGWKTIDSKKYYFNSSGEMVTGWNEIANLWYYFESSGSMKEGWLTESGQTYYLKPSTGEMLTEWQSIDGYWYYFNGSGQMQKGWVQLGGYWYYLKPDSSFTAWRGPVGSMLENTSAYIDGKTYNFNSSGVCTNP